MGRDLRGSKRGIRSSIIDNNTNCFIWRGDRHIRWKFLTREKRVVVIIDRWPLERIDAGGGERSFSFFNFFIFRLEKFSWKFTNIVSHEHGVWIRVRSFIFEGRKWRAEGRVALYFIYQVCCRIYSVYIYILCTVTYSCRCCFIWRIRSRLKNFKNESYL